MKRSDLINQALRLDREVHRFVRRQSAEAWMRLNLTVPQLKTLFFVSNEGGTSPGRLAQALKVTPSNVTGIIDRLVEQGLLSRQSSPADRRVLRLAVTVKGEDMLAGLRERRTSVLRDILFGLSAEELETLVSGLTALARSTRERAATDRADDEHDNQSPEEVVPLSGS